MDKVTPITRRRWAARSGDKFWFFTADRYTKPQTNQTTRFTGFNYTFGERGDPVRVEGHVRHQPEEQVDRLVHRTHDQATNNAFGVVLDQASLYDNSTKQNLMVFNYTNVLSSKLFLEGQYSRKTSATMDTGSRFSDRIKGTPISDRSRTVGTDNPRFNSPTFCAVCYDSKGIGWLEHRDNWDWYAKVSYFLSTDKAGSHSFSFGFDNYKEWRKNNNWQSGSAYTSAPPRPSSTARRSTRCSRVTAPRT